MGKNLISKKILITGGSGYVGGFLSKYLFDKGLDITISTSQLKKSNLIKSISIDWKKPINLSSKFDIIIHAAGIPSKICEKDPELAFKFNYEKTKELLDHAINSSCEKFYYISTAHVYASPLVGTFDDESKKNNQHPYAASQRMAEDYLLSKIQKNMIQGSVIRLTNCFGPPATLKNDCWNLSINQFVLSAICNQTILIKNNPYNRRDFISLSEFARLFFQIISMKNKNPKEILIASSEAREILDVANEIKKIIERETKLKIQVDYDKKIHTKSELKFITKNLNKINLHYDKNVFEETIIDLIKYIRDMPQSRLLELNSKI